MKHFQPLFLALAVMLPALRAAPAVSWENVPKNVAMEGASTVTTKQGKTLKAEGVSFTDTTVELVGGTSVPREEIKEVVVRRKSAKKKGLCCDALWFGPLLTVFGGQMMATEYFPLGIIAIAVGVPIAAVTLPPALLIEAFRHFPTTEAYKVVP